MSSALKLDFENCEEFQAGGYMPIYSSAGRYLGQYRNVPLRTRLFLTYFGREFPELSQLVSSIRREALFSIDGRRKWMPIGEGMLERLINKSNSKEKRQFTYQNFGYDSNGKSVQVILDYLSVHE